MPPTDAPPTDTPAVTAKPTKTPKATAAPGANLVVGKFEIVADAVVAEMRFDAVFVIKNTGTEDAAPFQAAVLAKNTEDGAKGESEPFSVEGGLAAGDSVEVTITMTLPKDAVWTLTATADSANTVAETNENDNTRDASVKVLAGLPDLQWANGGFSMTASQTNPGHYDTAYDFINKGTADYAGETSFIGVTWYRDEDSASGDFPDVPVGDLAIDEERVLEQSLEFPSPGTYTVYAFLDTHRVVPELNEDNNEVQINVTVP